MRQDAPSFTGRLLLVVGCAVAILAMHGVSAHVSPIAVAGASSHGDELAAMSDEAQLASAHHQGTGLHCPSCGHETAAGLCALIVTAAVGWQARRPNALRFQMRGPVALIVRLWSPDPPVPKPSFAIA